MSNDKVLYETRGRVALITLNRPEARNAVNGDVAEAMEAAIDQLEADPGVWVGVLRANTEGQNNPVFSAGADLKAINSGDAGRLGTKRGGFGGFVYRERNKPVIVAVDGLATAGGCEIVLAADLVVAAFTPPIVAHRVILAVLCALGIAVMLGHGFDGEEGDPLLGPYIALVALVAGLAGALAGLRRRGRSGRAG